MSADFVFTSESVTDGHPDKLCDQISDAIVDHYMAAEKTARVTAECAVSSGVIFLAARISSGLNLDLAVIARRVLEEVGYTHGDFNSRDCSVMISQAALTGSDSHQMNGAEVDAVDLTHFPASHPATLFGYACRHTDNYMPLPISIANALAMRLSTERKRQRLDYLAPDGQVQVAVRYRDNAPVGIHSINLITNQWRENAPALGQLREDVRAHVIEPVLAEFSMALERAGDALINPDGILLVGGPAQHSGMTGRKTGIDNYGHFARQSATALSGKDPLRIERIGAYAARYAAKHIVAAGLAEECEVQLSYAVSQAVPVSVRACSFGSGVESDAALSSKIQKVFDFRPGVIMRDLGLQELLVEKKRFYQDLATFGHMGREDLGAPWERLDRLGELAAL